MPYVFIWFITAFLLIWTGIAVFAAIRPYYFWKVTQGWKAVKEPPRAYFIFSRIIAVLFSVIGIYLLTVGYWSRLF
ncbi:DUF6199 family natural product biosynthesis protein [Paenibacillus apii]|uniref:DUF6199 family natural product biosynthesis protein n=1 Tax=Paenibacillus apii TaxID=1850370 RepID=UPI0038B25C48